MSDLHDLSMGWSKRESTQSTAVIATVVKTRGSAYRRPGAKMLILENGQSFGMVSGGCLEQDICLRALQLLNAERTLDTATIVGNEPSSNSEPIMNAERILGSRTMLSSERMLNHGSRLIEPFAKEARVIHYDTTRDDDMLLGSGTGCSGETVILLEKIDSMAYHLDNDNEYVAARVFYSSDPSSIPLGTLSLPETSFQQPTSLLDAEDTQSCYNQDLVGLLTASSSKVLSSKRSQTERIVTEDISLQIFFEYVPPIENLALFGAGQDSQPLLAQASALGWKVDLYDWRPAYASKARHSDSCKITCAPYESLAANHLAEKFAAKFAVIMTHNFERDLAALKFLLWEVGLDKMLYVGIVGPKRRTERLFERLSEEFSGSTKDAEREPEVQNGKPETTRRAFEKCLAKYADRIYSPAGLDLGGDSPQEVALSIVCEILAVRNKRSASHLRARKKPIHDPVEETLSNYACSSHTILEDTDEQTKLQQQKSLLGGSFCLSTDKQIDSRSAHRTAPQCSPSES